VGYKPFSNILYRIPPNVRTTVLYSNTLSTQTMVLFWWS